MYETSAAPVVPQRPSIQIQKSSLQTYLLPTEGGFQLPDASRSAFREARLISFVRRANDGSGGPRGAAFSRRLSFHIPPV